MKISQDAIDIKYFDELLGTINRKLTKKFISDTQFSINSKNELNCFLKNDIKGKYNILISNGAVGMYIEDLYGFFTTTLNTKLSLTTGVYKIGTYSEKEWNKNDEIEIYVDPYMRFDDNKMILAKNIGINIELSKNIKENVFSHSVQMNNIYTLNYGISIEDFKVVKTPESIDLI
jgi:hypothetical protein